MRGKAYGILLLWGVLCLSAQADVVDAVIDGKSAGYRFLETSEKPWRLCASLPQARDRFFWAVAWGLVEQSKRLGATIGIYQAGGYEHLDVQKQQIESCIKDGADAVLIAAIDPQALAAEQEALTKKGIVIIDLINGLDGNNIAAHSLPPVTDAGRLLAE